MSVSNVSLNTDQIFGGKNLCQLDVCFHVKLLTEQEMTKGGQEREITLGVSLMPVGLVWKSWFWIQLVVRTRLRLPGTTHRPSQTCSSLCAALIYRPVWESAELVHLYNDFWVFQKCITPSPTAKVHPFWVTHLRWLWSGQNHECNVAKIRSNPGMIVVHWHCLVWVNFTKPLCDPPWDVRHTVQ